MIRAFLLASVPLLAANEIRGAILAAPALYALYLSGGTWMAAWIAFCSLMGIALTIIVPLWAASALRRRMLKA